MVAMMKKMWGVKLPFGSGLGAGLVVQKFALLSKLISLF